MTTITEEQLLHKLYPEHSKVNRNTTYRIKRYFGWVLETNQGLENISLENFKQYLLDVIQLSEYDAGVYLSAVRSMYRKLLKDEQALRRLLDESLGNPDVVSVVIEKMKKASDSRTAQIKAQAPAGSHKYWSEGQVEDFLNAIHVDDVKSFRDRAMISLLFCTGLRDVEIVALKVEDLRHFVNGKVMLRVGAIGRQKERFIDTEGKFSWVLQLVEAWLRYARITEGFVFRRIRKNGVITQSGLSTRSVHEILEKYSLKTDDGEERITLLDIRYTHSRLLYKAGVPIQEISKNLGHQNIAVTAGYIGEFDAISPQSQIYESASYIPKISY